VHGDGVIGFEIIDAVGGWGMMGTHKKLVQYYYPSSINQSRDD
jgi:hypothetical protein